jgi:hypothetical protein
VAGFGIVQCSTARVVLGDGNRVTGVTGILPKVRATILPPIYLFINTHPTNLYYFAGYLGYPVVFIGF